MNPAVRQVRDFFVSLKLTVVLLVLSIVLIFAATLAQVDLGIWAVQQQFFRSFVALWHVGPVFVPLPGGYLIGGLLLLNLISAHLHRLKWSWRKSGLWLAHAGLILLLLGELLTGLCQEDFQMSLAAGETKNYAESQRLNELAIIETTDPKIDAVVAIPESLLARQSEFHHAQLPFRVVVRAYHPNAALQLRTATAGPSPSLATAGVGPKLVVQPAPLTSQQDAVNAPAAFVELIGAEGSLGIWTVSTQLAVAQNVTSAGRTWRIGLRAARAYQPFSITLKQAQHDVYPGTDIPKNFSSRIQLTTPDGRDNREVLIYMNNPLRYAGLTFYQYQMDSAHDTSVLQVVRNPGWLLPYLSCVMITLGLVIQFSLHLFAFIAKRRHNTAPSVE